MIIKEAEFVMSNTDVAKCPQTGLAEYAFIGRSNVGKSSLINMLTNRKGLAMTSSMPGKTLLINHFIINKEWYLVDLPGYGYAQRGKAGREAIRKIIDSYILNREAMTCLFVLLDSRHDPQQIDLDFIQWLGENGIPFALIFTKTDKSGRMRTSETLQRYREKLSEVWEELPPMMLTSSEKRIGRDEVLDYIEEINKSLTAQ